MKIPKDTMRRLQLAKMLLESVEGSLKRYDGVSKMWLIRKEDSVTAVHRRLVQARQELAAVSREFDTASAVEYRCKIEEENENGTN